MRERKEPTLSKSLIGRSICESAVGAVQVLFLSAGGSVYSLGCNHDGALGRASSEPVGCGASPPCFVWRLLQLCLGEACGPRPS